MPDLQNNIKSSQVCGPQPCELCFFAYLCIRNQVKRLSHICKYIFTFKEF